ncbi:hypothetical protein AB0D13_42210 [Streptomyces sp. NPDC048430]|uniref:hypothetical protein n=1 Tax=Bacteria TaxID=2 RepID=UPI00332FAD4D
MDKLSELSKPVAQIYYDELDSSVMRIGWFRSDEPKNPEPLYSQEYVSALEQKIAELEQAMRHIHGALLDITVPRVAIAKAAELAVDHAAMKEQSNG